MTPYEILEIPVNATAKQVKSAYRRLAAKRHPDAGGNADDFEILHRAYHTLIDEDRRARFDKEGFWEGPTPDNEDGNAWMLIGSKFIQIINSDSFPAYADGLRDLIQRLLQDDDKTLRRAKAESERSMQRALRMQGKFRSKGAPDEHFEGMIRDVVERSKERLELVDRQLARTNRAIALLVKVTGEGPPAGAATSSQYNQLFGGRLGSGPFGKF